MDSSVYDSAYYETGRESGKSLYSRYRWLPDLTLPMCRRIAEVCGIHQDDTILDFGCAKGFVVRAFRELGYRAEGIDASAWAVDNCDPAVRGYVKQATLADKEFDWIVAKDVLEHIPDPDLAKTIENLTTHARKGVFVVVPLSPSTGAPYVVPEYEADVTHVQRLTLGDWAMRLRRFDVCVASCYRVCGVKDNYSQFAEGNGFLFVRKDAGEEQ